MTSTSPTLPPVTESVSNGSEGDRPRWSARQLWADRRTNPLDLVTGAVYVLFGLQLIGLALVSVRLFDHYHLGRDFSVYYQAWWLIAHGHLNPFSSPSGNTFLKNHFELIMWVLAPLYWVNHSAIDLLWIQDVALVGAEVVIFRWAIDALRRHPGAGLPAVPTAVSVALLLVLNPLLYATAFDDFHSESIAVLFVALAARDLYNGRNRRALLWVAGLLLCGDVAAVYVVAIGLSALVSSRKSRVTGLIVIVVGVAWLQLIAAIGADTGSGLASRYGYLTNGLKPGQHASILWVVQGMLHHPGRPWNVVRQRWQLVLDVVRPGGVVGVVSPWVVFLAVLTLLPNVLIPQTLFIEIGFQNVVVPLFVIVGSVLVLDWLARRRGQGHSHAHGSGDHGGCTAVGGTSGRTTRIRTARLVAYVIGIAVVCSSVAFSLPRLHQTYSGRLTVSGATAAMLSSVHSKIPTNAEVVASAIVMGRFGDRPLLYQVWTDQATFPVVPGVPVVFVLALPPTNPDPTIDPEASPAGIEADIGGLLRNPHVTVLGRSPVAAVLEWIPPPGVGVIALPPSGADLNR